jgi:hypothetical protein
MPVSREKRRRILVKGFRLLGIAMLIGLIFNQFPRLLYIDWFAGFDNNSKTQFISVFSPRCEAEMQSYVKDWNKLRSKAVSNGVEGKLISCHARYIDIKNSSEKAKYISFNIDNNDSGYGGHVYAFGGRTYSELNLLDPVLFNRGCGYEKMTTRAPEMDVAYYEDQYYFYREYRRNQFDNCTVSGKTMYNDNKMFATVDIKYAYSLDSCDLDATVAAYCVSARAQVRKDPSLCFVENWQKYNYTSSCLENYMKLYGADPLTCKMLNQAKCEFRPTEEVPSI